jgi:hypothetical protein
MEELPDIKQLDAEEKDALIVALWEEVQKLRLQLVKKPKDLLRKYQEISWALACKREMDIIER